MFKFSRSKKKPNWVCGHTELDEQCADGPDANGQCCGGFTCHPVKKDDRWYCNRSVDRGGPCHAGPLEDGTCSTMVPPCQPQRSVEAKHRLLTQAIILISLGVLMLIVGAEVWSKQLQPGPLSSVHSGNVACGSCHQNFGLSPLKSMHLLLSNKLEMTNSKSCVNCHSLGDHPFNAHNQPTEKMTKMRDAKKSAGARASSSLQRLSQLVLGDDVHKRKLECVVCHKEHQGNQHMLLKMNDKTCQSCHVHTFSGFADHPEFNNYPHRQRTHIIFDHVSHLKKHFKDEKFQQLAPQQCADCHQLSPLGNMMLVKNYETSCANCHDKEIIGKSRAGEKGILVFAIPGLDIETLQQKKIDIGEWPSDAEGELNPFMVAILAENPDFIPLYQRVKDLDLADLSDASREQLQDVGKLAWLIKAFLYELSTQGTATIYEHIYKISDADVTYRQHLPELMPEDNVDALINIAFPHLQQEVKQHKEHKATKLTTKATEDKQGNDDKAIEAEDWQSHGGWYRQGTDIYYLPRKHADVFLTSWLTIASHLNQDVQSLQNHKLFWLLADAKAPGTCAKCHSVAETANGQPQMQWRMRQPVAFKQRFTRFVHKDHMSVMGESGCKRCHEFDKNADYLSSFEHQDPSKFQSNFKPILKSVCAECHTRVNHNDSCLTCHEYHVGEFNPKAPKTELK